MRVRFLSTVSVLAASVLLAACGGSSGNPDTAHVVPAPYAAQTLKPPKLPPAAVAPTTLATGATGATAGVTGATSAPTPAAASVPVPSKGPLSVEPKIAVPSTPAPTKLVSKDLITGTGAVAAAGDELTVDYVGALYKTGKVFSTSWLKGGKTGQTFPFQLGVHAVIPGWDQGLVGMRVGGRRELTIPPALAYGAQGSGPSIPPDSTLIFIVDLLAVSKTAG
jgi:peptidylprolyl isomerase